MDHRPPLPQSRPMDPTMNDGTRLLFLFLSPSSPLGCADHCQEPTTLPCWPKRRKPWTFWSRDPLLAVVQIRLPLVLGERTHLQESQEDPLFHVVSPLHPELVQVQLIKGPGPSSLQEGPLDLVAVILIYPELFVSCEWEWIHYYWSTQMAV